MQLTGNKIYSKLYLLHRIGTLPKLRNNPFGPRVRFEFQTPEIQSTNYINLSGGVHNE